MISFLFEKNSGSKKLKHDYLKCSFQKMLKETFKVESLKFYPKTELFHIFQNLAVKATKFVKVR
jgi:hypothetical protein